MVSFKINAWSISTIKIHIEFWLHMYMYIKILKLKQKLGFSCIMVKCIKPPWLLGYAYEGNAHRADNNNK